MLNQQQKRNYGILGLLVIGLILFQTFIGGESRAEELPKWDITSFTHLGGESFSSDQRVNIAVTVKNLQESTDSIYLEAVILSDSIAEDLSLMGRTTGIVYPTPNCYEEEKFVATVLLDKVGPGESITTTLKVIMPDKDTLTQDGKNNWGDSFVQIVGLYEECGNYETYVKDTFVLIGKESTGETCESKSDCSGWFWKGLECIENKCVDTIAKDDTWATDLDFEFTGLKDFYEDYKTAFWVVICLSGFMFILWIYSPPKPKHHYGVTG